MHATTDFMERIRVSPHPTSHALLSLFTNYYQDNLENQDHEDRLKSKAYASNLMIKVVEKLEALSDKNGVQVAEKSKNIAAHNQNPEISQAKYILDNVSPQAFTQRTGLPPAYRKAIAAFEDIVEERNKACHDTEFEFARLLLRRQFKDPVIAHEWNCDHWAALLLWVTGYASLKDMAAVARDVRLPSIAGWI